MKQANTDFFDKILSEATEEETILSELSFSITNRIMELMAQNNMRQKDLAQRLHKSEAEISKWLSGMHNFTIKTIAKLQGALQATVVTTTQNSESTVYKKYIPRTAQNFNAIFFANAEHFENAVRKKFAPPTHFAGQTPPIKQRPAFVRVGDGYSKSNF